MSLLWSLKAQNFEINLGGKARRGIDFPTLFVGIGGVVHEILAQEGKTRWVSAIVVVVSAISLLRAQPPKTDSAAIFRTHPLVSPPAFSSYYLSLRSVMRVVALHLTPANVWVWAYILICTTDQDGASEFIIIRLFSENKVRSTFGNLGFIGSWLATLM